MVGRQQPRIEWVPPGEEHPDTVAALELVEAAGILLDPWQKRIFAASLRRNQDKWAAFEVGLVCPRQNGKNELIVARELAGLFVLGERLIIHSAHQFDTSIEAFRRLVEVVENTDWLLAEVKGPRDKGIRRSHGEEGIELRTGQRIRFRTRTKGGGRGFTGDCLILDEAMILPEAAHGALLPTLSARPDPQVWYTGSAVDQMIHDDGVVLARVRARGVAGGDPSLYYAEFSVDAPNPDELDDATASDPVSWGDANPALGIRIHPEYVAQEQRSMDRRTFAVERLGVGDWPRLDANDSVISFESWRLLEDEDLEIQDPVALAWDIAPDRSWASISAAGLDAEGNYGVQTVERRRGTGWVIDRLVDHVNEHKPVVIVCDGAGPAKSLVPELQQRRVGVKSVVTTAGELGMACGFLFDAVEQRTLRHQGSPELDSAIKGAATRPLGDAWAWKRKDSSVDITPLVAATLALWGFHAQQAPAPFIL